MIRTVWGFEVVGGRLDVWWWLYSCCLGVWKLPSAKRGVTPASCCCARAGQGGELGRGAAY